MIDIVLALTFLLAAGPRGPEAAIVVCETLRVYNATPAIEGDMFVKGIRYKLGEQIGEFYRDDTIDVLNIKDGIQSDKWGMVEYQIIVTDSTNDSLGILNFSPRIDTGWILIRWKDQRFIQFLDEKERSQIFDLKFMLFGQNVDITGSIETGSKNYRIFGALVVLLITAFFFLIFWKKSSRAFGLDKATIGMKFKIWLVFVFVILVVMCGLNYNDLKVLITGSL